MLFSEATLTISPGERVALFGRNGSGKSTLLKIIAGEEAPDDGDVSVPRGYTIGYLKQHLSFSEPTVLAEACLAIAGDPIAEQYKAEIILAGLGFSEAELELSPSALSGGFQIRINLAKLILSEPNMLLLIQTHLNKVLATAQCAQLTDPPVGAAHRFAQRRMALQQRL